MRALAELTQDATHPERSNGAGSFLPTSQALAPSDSQMLDVLVAAICAPDRHRFGRVVDAALKLGHTHRDIANQYIPAIARRLGEDWIEDRADFALVSIACARLQAYLRHTGLEWFEKASLTKPVKARALLIVPEFEQHTLGATLLCGQLRSQGVCTTTDINTPVGKIPNLVEGQRFDAIMISSSQSETLELLASVVSMVREICADAPIIIGGNVLEQTQDALAVSGADLAATSWQDAMTVLKPAPDIIEADLIGGRG